MRLWTLPIVWTVVLNIIPWLAIHLGVAYIVTRMPAARFCPRAWIYGQRSWEAGGSLYERLFRIKAWKGLLPDAAPWFPGGFAKKSLQGLDRDYLERFVRETCRGELVHWITMLWTPIFFLWNPAWACLVIIGYALAANVPCILAQRYNRIRFTKVLRRMQA
jgi:glycosyl-4,4'-diaponeurosporenoate acyltransferase